MRVCTYSMLCVYTVHRVLPLLGYETSSLSRSLILSGFCVCVSVCSCVSPSWVRYLALWTPVQREHNRQTHTHTHSSSRLSLAFPVPGSTGWLSIPGDVPKPHWHSGLATRSIVHSEGEGERERTPPPPSPLLLYKTLDSLSSVTLLWSTGRPRTQTCTTHINVCNTQKHVHKHNHTHCRELEPMYKRPVLSEMHLDTLKYWVM